MITSCTQFQSARNRDSLRDASRRVPVLPYHEYIYDDDFDRTETHYLIVDFDTYWSDGRNTAYFAKASPLTEPIEVDHHATFSLALMQCDLTNITA